MRTLAPARQHRRSPNLRLRTPRILRMSFYKQSRHYFTRVKQSYFPAKLTTAEIEFVNNHLSPQLQSIFFAQPVCDQRHGFLVFEKCKTLFKDENKISDDELFLASALHDLAKTQSFKSVTLRIFAALVIGALKSQRIEKLSTTKISFLKKIATYANHSELSAKVVAERDASEFVYEAIKYHHSSQIAIDTNCKNPLEVKLFIEADTL